MNKVILKGRPTKNPEVKFIQTVDANGQQLYARFILAVEDWSFRDKETGSCHVDYIPCHCYNKTAEIIRNNVKRGTELLVSGKWRSSSFLKGSEMEYRNSLQILEVEFCGKKEDSCAGQDSHTRQDNHVRQDKPIRLYWENARRQPEPDSFNVEEELAKLQQEYRNRQALVNRH